MNAYRMQQLAIEAAIDAGEYHKASDILHAGITPYLRPPDTISHEIGYNSTLTEPRKSGIIKLIARKLRRFGGKENEKCKRMD